MINAAFRPERSANGAKAKKECRHNVRVGKNEKAIMRSVSDVITVRYCFGSGSERR